MTVSMIVSVIILLLLVYSGFKDGLFGGVAMLFLLVIAVSIAMGFCTRLASVGWLSSLGAYGEPIMALSLFIVGFFLLQTLVTLVAPPTVKLNQRVNAFGGIGVGLVTGLLVTGFIMTTFYMLPWTGVNRERRVALYADQLFTRAFGRLTRMTGGREFSSQDFWNRLSHSEHDRICARRLLALVEPMRHFYELREGGRVPPPENELRRHLLEAVGQEGLACAWSQKEYRLITYRSIWLGEKRRVVAAYDAEPAHLENGKPVYHVLYVWKADEQPPKMTGTVEKVEKDEFETELQEYGIARP